MKISHCDLTTSNNAVWDYLRRPSFPVATCAWQAIACKGRGTDLSGELFYSQASHSKVISNGWTIERLLGDLRAGHWMSSRERTETIECNCFQWTTSA